MFFTKKIEVKTYQNHHSLAPFFFTFWQRYFSNKEGETTTLWMPGGFVWSSGEYRKMWQAFRKEQDRIDTSWDDWNKLEEKNTQEEAKEHTRNERKRKQEAEDRAEKRRTGMGSSTTPCVHVKLSTCDRSSSKLVIVQLGKCKE